MISFSVLGRMKFLLGKKKGKNEVAAQQKGGGADVGRRFSAVTTQ